MCGRPFGTWRSAARPRWAGTSPSAITAARYGTTIIPAATEAVLSAVGASGRPGWPNVRPTSCPFPTSTSSSPCPTSSARWYWATVSSCIGCSLTAQGDSSGGGGRPQAPGSADRGADGVAHLGAEAGTSSSRSLCRARRRVGDPRQVLGKHRDCARRPGTTLGVLPAQLVLIGPGAGRGLPRQVPGGRGAAYQAGQLQFAGSTLPLASPAAWATSIRALYQKDWVVYAKEPFGGPEQVLKYLTGYTHRVALSNHRLVKLEDGRVTFLWKDYADGCRRKEMTLEAVEFVRRFALHIIPKGLVRIRQYGLLAHRDRGERLALCRSLLAAGAGPSPAPETDSPPPSASAGSTDSDQSPSGAGPAPSPVEPKSAAPSRMGISILVVLVSLLVASGDTTSFASSPAVPPAAVLVDDRCPSCGVGHLQTIWQAGRPGRVERQRIPILDSS